MKRRAHSNKTFEWQKVILGRRMDFLNDTHVSESLVINDSYVWKP